MWLMSASVKGRRGELGIPVRKHPNHLAWIASKLRPGRRCQKSCIEWPASSLSLKIASSCTVHFLDELNCGPRAIRNFRPLTEEAVRPIFSPMLILSNPWLTKFMSSVSWSAVHLGLPSNACLSFDSTRQQQKATISCRMDLQVYTAAGTLAQTSPTYWRIAFSCIRKVSS